MDWRQRKKPEKDFSRAGIGETKRQMDAESWTSSVPIILLRWNSADTKVKARKQVKLTNFGPIYGCFLQNAFQNFAAIWLRGLPDTFTALFNSQILE
jgi:hypothetical protein